MKRNFLDKLIGVFSPEAELRRIRARGRAELLKRSYDAAQTFNTDDWVSATGGSANSEIRGAQTTLRNKGRDAIRNNPYARRALNVATSAVVGTGIVPNIRGKSKLQTKRVKEAWKEWGETTLCDATGRHNFYGLQSLAFSSTMESGEVVAPKEISKLGYHIRILESDHLVSHKEVSTDSEGNVTIQGVKLDKFGRVKSYYLYESHPGESVAALKEKEVPADRIMHVFRQERPGQVRGVSWFHPVLRLLQDLNEYQQATLVSRKIGACFSVFVTTNDTDATLSPADLKAKREAESMLTPGSVRYMSQGEKVEIATPPTISGYSEFVNQYLRELGAGLNLPYSSMTNDYSQFNFSSSKQEKNEFRTVVEQWRWQMLIPQFCDPSFQHFLEWCRVAKGIDTTGIYCEWVTPAWLMIDPTKEIPALKEGLRNGLLSRQKAVLELGYDPEQLDEEIAESNKKLDELGIILDSDPRKTSGQGQLQITNQSSSQGSQTNEEND